MAFYNVQYFASSTSSVVETKCSRIVIEEMYKAVDDNVARP